MKKLTKRSILAVLALVLAVVTLGTTSYAWFTLGNTVIVSDIELNVQGGEGLEVTYVTNGNAETGYVSVLTTEDLLNYLAADYGVEKADSDETAGDTFKNSFEWDAVTSTNGTAFQSFTLDQESRTPSLDSIDTVQSLASGMLEFKLRFRTKAVAAAENQQVGLIWNQVTLNSGVGNSWEPEVTFTNSKGVEVAAGANKTYFASDAARVSITDTKNSTTVVYENPESASNTVLSNNEPNWTGGAHAYYQKITQVVLSETFSTHKAAKTEVAVPVDAVAMFTETPDSEGYYTADITVRIYIEGFDAEAFNSILSGMIKVGLQFKLKTDIPVTTP